MYVRRAVATYNRLFSDLQPFLQQLPPDPGALKLTQLLQLMEAYV